MLMTSWQATTFLIGEYFSEDDPNPVFTVADGLIWLRQSVQRNSMVRKRNAGGWLAPRLLDARRRSLRSGQKSLDGCLPGGGRALRETGVIASFEQRPDRLRNRVIADLIEKGQVG